MNTEHVKKRYKKQKGKLNIIHRRQHTITYLQRKKTKLARVIATDFAGNLDFVRNSERPYIKTDSVTWLRGSRA